METGGTVTGDTATGEGEQSAPARDPHIRPLFFGATLILSALAALAMLVHKPAAETQSPIMLAKWFAARQDIPVVAGMILFFALFGARARAIGNGVKSVLGTRQAVALLAGFALIAWALRTLVLFDFDLSRDEKLVAFDIAIFTDGRLFAPIASFWRDSYEALNTLYTLPVGNREGWVSGYLPVNAALRALLGHALPAAAASPVQLLVAGLALWRIALRLWPSKRLIICL